MTTAALILAAEAAARRSPPPIAYAILLGHVPPAPLPAGLAQPRAPWGDTPPPERRGRSPEAVAEAQAIRDDILDYLARAGEQPTGAVAQHVGIGADVALKHLRRLEHHGRVAFTVITRGPRHIYWWRAAA